MWNALDLEEKNYYHEDSSRSPIIVHYTEVAEVDRQG